MRGDGLILVVTSVLVLATWADENGGSCSGGKKGTSELCGVHEEELVDEKSKEWEWVIKSRLKFVCW